MTDLLNANREYKRLIESDIPQTEFSYIPVVAPITPNILADAFGKIESGGYAVYQIRISPLDFADFRKWTWSHVPSPFAAIGEPDNYKKPCLRGFLWEALVISDYEVPAGTVYCMASLKGVSPQELEDHPQLASVCCCNLHVSR